MIVSKTTGSQPLLLFAAIAAAGLAVIVAGIYLFPLTIDEAYITYSHARNFARSGRLVYHPANPEFSISTPLYALILGLGGALGIPIPAFSKLLGAASIFGSSVYLSLLCYRHRMMWAALTSGLLLATSPLLWQTLGLESCFFLLLVLAAFYHSDRGQQIAAAVLAACAVLTRWEGIFAAGILGLSYAALMAWRLGAPQGKIAIFILQVFSLIPFVVFTVHDFLVGSKIWAILSSILVVGAILHNVLFAEKKDDLLIGFSGIYRFVVLERRVRWNAVAVFAAVLAPVLLYSSVANGTPVPMALQTQQGQGAIGFTGYGFGTSFLQGLLTTLRESLHQSPLHYLWIPLGIFAIHLLGLGKNEDAVVAELQDSEPVVSAPPDSRGRPGNEQSIWWVRGIIAWGVLHVAGYALLELPPYPWSFVPLVPGAVVLAGLALQRLVEWAGKPELQVLSGGAILLFLLLAQSTLLEATVSAVTAEHPPSAAKTNAVSTGRGYNLYRDAGEWLDANAPSDATVAAVSSGIIGYYAERAMIDLSGSLQLEVAQALKRSDPFFAILALLPDYLVLEESRFIYDVWQKGSPWFAAHYHLAKRFTDEHTESSTSPSLVVLRRLDGVGSLDSATTVEDDWPLGFNISFPLGLELYRTVIYGSELLPGSWMHVRLDCEIENGNSSYLVRGEWTTSFILTDVNYAIVAEQPLENAMTAFYNRSWREEERFPIYVQFFLPESLTPGTYNLDVLSLNKETKAESIARYARVTVGNSATP